jgi:hypothetical protein
MHNIAIVSIALIGGFLLQIVWWRIIGPSLSSVLLLFVLVFATLTAGGLHFGILDLQAADFCRLTLLYTSVVLSYTCVCTVLEVEVPSPTASIITYIADCDREGGCSDDDLIRHFAAQDALLDRLNRMAESGLLRITDGICTLTGKGVFFARLFDFAARLFGLSKGG